MQYVKALKYTAEILTALVMGFELYFRNQKK